MPAGHVPCVVLGTRTGVNGTAVSLLAPGSAVAVPDTRYSSST